MVKFQSFGSLQVRNWLGERGSLPRLTVKGTLTSMSENDLPSQLALAGI